jgi:hypothetical protein
MAARHEAGRMQSQRLVAVGRYRATGIDLPDTARVVKSRRITDWSRVAIGRVHANSESKSRPIPSSAAVITAAVISSTNAAVEAARGRRESMPAIEIPTGRCGKGMSAAAESMSSSRSARMATAAVTCSHRRHGTKSHHRNRESYRRNCGLCQTQESVFHKPPPNHAL